MSFEMQKMNRAHILPSSGNDFFWNNRIDLHQETDTGKSSKIKSKIL